MVFGHFAVLSAATRVAQLFADRAFKETFTALAANCPVMASYIHRQVVTLYTVRHIFIKEEEFTRGSVTADDAVLDGEGHSSARRLVPRDETHRRSGRVHPHRHPAIVGFHRLFFFFLFSSKCPSCRRLTHQSSRNIRKENSLFSNGADKSSTGNSQVFEDGKGRARGGCGHAGQHNKQQHKNPTKKN